jgi:hypothetical protein
MTEAPGHPSPAARRRTSPSPPAVASAQGVRATRKKELTHRLFGYFLKAVERGEEFEWRGFLDGLEAVLWQEALTLAEGSCRDAAALIGIPYSTYMNRFRPGRRGPDDPEPSSSTGA